MNENKTTHKSTVPENVRMGVLFISQSYLKTCCFVQDKIKNIRQPQYYLVKTPTLMTDEYVVPFSFYKNNETTKKV